MLNQKLVLVTLVCCSILLVSICEGEEKDDCDKCGPTRVSLSLNSYEKVFQFNIEVHNINTQLSDDWLQGRSMLLQMHQEMPRKG